MGAIITPFVSVANTIMIPFLLGGFLYYLTNPIVIFLQKYFKINRIIGILLTLCALVWGLGHWGESICYRFWSIS